jgi:hypothetical protein
MIISFADGFAVPKKARESNVLIVAGAGIGG